MAEIVYSRQEQDNSDMAMARPLVPTGHMASEERFSFAIALMGRSDAEPAAAHDDLSAISIVSAPLRHPEGELLATHAYETAAEAMAVGDAFPEHDIYEELSERWSAAFASQQDPRAAHSPFAIARYALTGVYLFGPATRTQEVVDYPTYEASRLTLPSNKRFRYVFAQGSDAKPLMERRFEPDIWHGDLAVPAYQTFRKIVRAHDEILNTDAALAQISQLEIAHHMPPTASPEDLRWASIIATKIAAETSKFLPEGEAREAHHMQVYKDIMGQIFGDSFAAADPER